MLQKLIKLIEAKSCNSIMVKDFDDACGDSFEVIFDDGVSMLIKKNVLAGDDSIEEVANILVGENNRRIRKESMKKSDPEKYKFIYENARMVDHEKSLSHLFFRRLSS